MATYLRGGSRLASPFWRLLQPSLAHQLRQQSCSISVISIRADTKQRGYFKPTEGFLSARKGQMILNKQQLRQISNALVAHCQKAGVLAPSSSLPPIGNTGVLQQSLPGLSAGGVVVPSAGDHGSLYNFGPGLVTLWTLILGSNLIGLAGYSIGPTIHLAVVFPTALTFWLSIILSSVQWSPNNFLAHLVPPGAPLALAPFLSVIEAVSIAIRPITLSVRLVANLSAGHLILGLIGGGVVSGTLLSQSLSLGVSTVYVAFEIFVGCIQTYIFCNLLSLYAEEHS